MGSRPVTIRLLDPPLHEFLPHDKEEIEALAQSMGIGFEQLFDKVTSLQETNPMLGHRGCRLAITWPEIARMQVTAIMEAAIEVTQEEGIALTPEIMVPLVSEPKELSFLKNIIVTTAEAIMEQKGVPHPVFGGNDDRGARGLRCWPMKSRRKPNFSPSARMI